jgi:hypothetical protein
LIEWCIYINKTVFYYLFKYVSKGGFFREERIHKRGWFSFSHDTGYHIGPDDFRNGSAKYELG